MTVGNDSTYCLNLPKRCTPAAEVILLVTAGGAAAELSARTRSGSLREADEGANTPHCPGSRYRHGSHVLEAWK